MDKTLYTQKNEILREMLRQLRLDADLQQQDLAQLINDQQSKVSRYESGTRKLDLAELSIICNACGSDLVTFVGKYEERLRKEGLL